MRSKVCSFTSLENSMNQSLNTAVVIQPLPDMPYIIFGRDFSPFHVLWTFLPEKSINGSRALPAALEIANTVWSSLPAPGVVL